MSEETMPVLDNEQAEVEADEADYVSLSESFVADEIPFSELDKQAQNEVELCEMFGYK